MEPLRRPLLLLANDRCVRARTLMLDIILLALGVGAFGLFAAYAAGCERV